MRPAARGRSLRTVRPCPGMRSLLQAWSSVSNWRHLLLESPASATCEIVHAHCFPGGYGSGPEIPCGRL